VGNLWTAERHPTDFPNNPHWSPMLIASHSGKYSMWNPDSNSSPGVESMAETGSLGQLQTEINAAGKKVKDTGKGSLFFPDGLDDQVNIGTFKMDRGHRLVSSVSMIAPSPDWFSGFHDYRPISDGKWLASFSIESYPYDAGTDSGSTYMSSNSPTNPQVNTFRLDSDTSTVFLNDGEVLPVARWSCDLLPETTCRQLGGARFFRNMQNGEPRTQRCKWLNQGNNSAKRKARFCNRDSPVSFIASAAEVCRKTCKTCPGVKAPSGPPPTAAPVLAPADDD